VALLEKRRYLNNRSGDFPQVILIVPSHVPNIYVFIYLYFIFFIVTVEKKRRNAERRQKKIFCSTQKSERQNNLNLNEIFV
jgi:hypothetical protein